MLCYYRPYVADNVYYSVDNIRLDLEFVSDKTCSQMLAFLNSLEGYQYYMSLKDFQYRHLFVFGIKNLSFSLGLVFNGASSKDVVKGFLDFNPNKILGDIQIGDGFIKALLNPFHEDMTCKSFREALCELFLAVFKRLTVTCLHMTLKRWDLAVDVPVSRQEVQLFKDQRKYHQFYMSKEDFTEYLGCSDTAGRVKVYNKRLEAELDYDLTRIEVTLDDKEYASLSHWWPEVYRVDTIPLDSDKLIVGLLREVGPDRKDFYLRRINDRRTKQKYKALLVGERFTVSEKAHAALVEELGAFDT